MLRLLGLTLVLVASAATAANADDRFERPAAGGIKTALHQSVALAGKRQLSLYHRTGIMPLQIGGALAFAQPSLRAIVAGSPRPRTVLVYPLVFGGQDLAFRRPAPVRWLDLNDSESTLAYPVTDSLSLGLGYRFLRSEDLVFKVAKTGSLDSSYQSHNVLFQAHWEF